MSFDCAVPMLSNFESVSITSYDLILFVFLALYSTCGLSCCVLTETASELNLDDGEAVLQLTIGICHSNRHKAPS